MSPEDYFGDLLEKAADLMGERMKNELNLLTKLKCKVTSYHSFFYTNAVIGIELNLSRDKCIKLFERDNTATRHGLPIRICAISPDYSEIRFMSFSDFYEFISKYNLKMDIRHLSKTIDDLNILVDNLNKLKKEQQGGK